MFRSEGAGLQRAPLQPTAPRLPDWAQTDDFLHFDRQTDALSAADHSRFGDPVPDGGRETMLALAAQGRTPAPRAPSPTKAPGPSAKLGLFHKYIKETYGLTDEEADRALKDYARWQAKNPWKIPTVAGATRNVNGQISPAQDRIFRSVAEGLSDPVLREKARRGYDDAVKSGKVKIVDDPTKP